MCERVGRVDTNTSSPDPPKYFLSPHLRSTNSREETLFHSPDTQGPWTRGARPLWEGHPPRHTPRGTTSEGIPPLGKSEHPRNSGSGTTPSVFYPLVPPYTSKFPRTKTWGGTRTGLRQKTALYRLLETHRRLRDTHEPFKEIGDTRR